MDTGRYRCYLMKLVKRFLVTSEGAVLEKVISPGPGVPGSNTPTRFPAGRHKRCTAQVSPVDASIAATLGRPRSTVTAWTSEEVSHMSVSEEVCPSARKEWGRRQEWRMAGTWVRQQAGAWQGHGVGQM